MSKRLWSMNNSVPSHSDARAADCYHSQSPSLALISYCDQCLRMAVERRKPNRWRPLVQKPLSPKFTVKETFWTLGWPQKNTFLGTPSFQKHECRLQDNQLLARRDLMANTGKLSNHFQKLEIWLDRVKSLPFTIKNYKKCRIQFQHTENAHGCWTEN